MSKTTPAFRRVASDASKGLVLKPALHAYLAGAKFPRRFEVVFEGKTVREPDGWFHPSEHPLWPARMLWLWHHHPELSQREALGYMGALSVTLGKALHSFIAVCLDDMGVLIQADVPVIDEATHARGEMDAALAIRHPALPTEVGFEFKCLAPESLVETPRGPVPAGDLRVGDTVLAWADDRVQVAPISGVQDNGLRPVWTIRTRQGREVGVTEEHPFMTERGWVKASQISPGDRVRVATGSVPDVGEWDAESWLVGALVGDGALTRRSTVGLHNSDPGVRREVERIAQGLGCHVRHYGSSEMRFTVAGEHHGGWTRNPVLELTRRMGLHGHGSYTKTIPVAVWEAGVDAWVAFLSGYFDADGTVVKRPYPSMSWASVNRRLLRDCQVMLALLGVRSSLVRVRGKYRGAEHISWRLMVRDAVAVMRLRDLLSPRSTKKIADLSGVVRSAPNLAHHRTAREEWDEVVEVSEGLARPTIALEVEAVHTHVTEGLVTHNSTTPLKKMPKDLDLDGYKQTWPGYWAQVQEYLRLSGYQMFIGVFLAWGHPWNMYEYHIPRDDAFIDKLAKKYREVLDPIAGRMPAACCSPYSDASKECPMRAACPIGQETMAAARRGARL